MDDRTRQRHLILWDGDCGFCRRSAAWAGRKDTAGRFEAMPYQEAPSPPMTPDLAAACEKAVHVITTDGEILKGGSASLFILGRIGYRKTARVLSLPILRPLVHLGYRVVAANRGFFGRLMFRRG